LAAKKKPRASDECRILILRCGIRDGGGVRNMVDGEPKGSLANKITRYLNSSSHGPSSGEVPRASRDKTDE
jgi:hypothetical protein